MKLRPHHNLLLPDSNHPETSKPKKSAPHPSGSYINLRIATMIPRKMIPRRHITPLTMSIFNAIPLSATPYRWSRVSAYKSSKQTIKSHTVTPLRRYTLRVIPHSFNVISRTAGAVAKLVATWLVAGRMSFIRK